MIEPDQPPDRKRHLPKEAANRQPIVIRAADLVPSRDRPAAAKAARAPAGRKSTKSARTPKRGRRYPMIVVVLLALGAGLGALAYAQMTEPARISASVSELQEIGFGYAADAEPGLSPMCGCNDVLASHVWRGVSFATKETAIEVNSTKATTLYRLTAPEQAEIAWFNPNSTAPFYYAEVVQLSVTDSEEFDPQSLLLPSTYIPGSVTLLRRRVYDVNINVITDQPLRIAQLGPTPLAAWLPARGAKLTLAADTPETAYPQEESNALALSESFPARPSGVFPYPYAYPAGDFLGPDLVVWTDTNAQVGAGEFRYTRTEPHVKGREVITAVVIRNPQFATRVGVMPFSSAFVRHQNNLWDSPPKDPDHRDMGWIDNPNAPATVSVSFPHGLLPARSYSRLYDYVKAHRDTEAGIEAPPRGREGDTFNETYRLPPLSRESGFTIWGKLSSVDLRGAVGNMQIEDSALAIPTPSSIGVSRLSAYNTEGSAGLEIAPRAQVPERSLRFSGRAAVAVNGTNKTRRADRVSNVALIGLVMGVIGLVLGLGSAVVRITESG
jgi:hypothetical protein